MKNNVLRMISGILFPIVFVALFILIGGTEHGATCWIGFGFTLLAYVIVMSVPLIIPNSESSYIFGMTSGTLAYGFFGVNFIIGLVFMIWDFEQWKTALIIEVILLVLFIVFMLQVWQTDETTAKKETKHNNEVSLIKDLVLKSKMIMDRCGDLEMKRSVRKVYDELNTCPSNYNRLVATVDESISYNLDILNQAVLSNDINAVNNTVKSVLSLVKERKELSR